MNKCFFGDSRDTLTELALCGVKVQCCVTSPPYFGLRDYGHEGQIGLEKTPAEYVANLVEVFAMVWEVLADDGVLWLNLGDSYANDGKRGGASGGKHASELHGSTGIGRTKRVTGLKPKDLIGIPWRVAFALQEAGWYLRQDIIWHKPSPMPESVKDRCTKAHEYLFLLTKQPRYFWDAKAMQEDGVCGVVPRMATRTPDGSMDERGVTRTSCAQRAGSRDGKRNRRSVWTIPTKPYKGAHFAVFPPALIEPCILAGSRPGDVILDPFFGSGTVGEVAQQHGRLWIGCEINKDYEALQQQRALEEKNSSEQC